MKPYHPRLAADQRERVAASLARVSDFWKAIDHRTQRDVTQVKYDLEKREICYHWLEMACRFTSMELGEIRLEILQSYGSGTADSALQPLDRNCAQAVLAAKNLFESASSMQKRMSCPQFKENIGYEELRKQLQESLAAINRQVQIYMEANPKTSSP